MCKIFIVLVFVAFIGSNTKELKKTNIRECNFYRFGKNVDQKVVKNFYLHFARTILAKNPESIAELFDKKLYPTAYTRSEKEIIDTTKLGSYFTKLTQMDGRKVIQLLEDKKVDEYEKIFTEIYLILLSKFEWKCVPFNKKFKSIYYSIKNRTSCGIEVDKWEPGNEYILRISYKQDLYDISITGSNKINGIQCNEMFYEGY